MHSSIFAPAIKSPYLRHGYAIVAGPNRHGSGKQLKEALLPIPSHRHPLEGAFLFLTQYLDSHSGPVLFTKDRPLFIANGYYAEKILLGAKD